VEPRAPSLRGPDVRGPDVRGPDVRGPDVRGPDVRGLRSGRLSCGGAGRADGIGQVAGAGASGAATALLSAVPNWTPRFSLPSAVSTATAISTGTMVTARANG
jgi:hypothetical protein